MLIMIKKATKKHARIMAEFRYKMLENMKKEFRGNKISKLIMEKLHEKAKKHEASRIGLQASKLGYPIYTLTGYKNNEKHLEIEI